MEFCMKCVNNRPENVISNPDTDLIFLLFSSNPECDFASHNLPRIHLSTQRSQCSSVLKQLSSQPSIQTRDASEHASWQPNTGCDQEILRVPNFLNLLLV